MRVLVAVLLVLVAGPLWAFSAKYDLHFKRWAEAYFPGYDWRWFKAQGMAESGLRPQAVSPCGAMGLMQIMPSTAKELGLRRPFVPELSIEAGIRYDRKLWRAWRKRGLKAYPEDLYFTFASYNAGLGHIEKAWRLAKRVFCWARVAIRLGEVTGRRASETISYVHRIRAYYWALKYA